MTFFTAPHALTRLTAALALLASAGAAQARATAATFAAAPA